MTDSDSVTQALTNANWRRLTCNICKSRFDSPETNDFTGMAIRKLLAMPGASTYLARMCNSLSSAK